MKCFLTMILIVLTRGVYCGVYIEPYLGYGFGSYNAKEPSGTFKNSMEGKLFGARVGIETNRVVAGFDFSGAKYKLTLDSYPPGTSEEQKAIFEGQGLSKSYYGIFFLYRLHHIYPYLGKVWGTYFFSAKGAGIQDSSNGEFFGMAGGFGSRPIETFWEIIDLHLNFEFRKLQSGEDHSTDEYIFSISIPLNV